MPTDDERRPLPSDVLTSAGEFDASDATPEPRVLHRILQIVERVDRKQAALGGDFEGLYQAVIGLQREVQFFTRRCEERGNVIRDFVSRVEENGDVSKEAALEFLQGLECAGTPIRSPSGTYRSLRAICGGIAEPDGEEPTEPGHSK